MLNLFNKVDKILEGTAPFVFGAVLLYFIGQIIRVFI